MNGCLISGLIQLQYKGIKLNKKNLLLPLFCAVFSYAQDKMPMDININNENGTEEKKLDNNVGKTTLGIGLDELISVVVQQNAKMKYEELNNKIIREDINYEKGNFESEFFVNVAREHTNKQNSIQESIARDNQSTYREDVSSTDMGIRGTNIYGTQWSAFSKTYSTESSLIDESNSGIDKEYNNALYLQVTQPILKGFGSKIGQTNINLAVLEDSLSKEEYKKKMMSLVEEIVVSYWKLYGSNEIYKTWKETIKIISEQKEDIQRKVRAGNMASINLLQIESALSSSKVELYSSLDMLEKEKNNILSLLNTSSLENNIILQATDKPLVENIKIPNLEDAISLSFKNFPEFNIILNKIEQSKLRTNYASDQMLPSLDLVGKINNDNLDKNLNGALSEAGSDDYVSWYAGFNFSIPIGGNLKASSELTKQKIKLQQVKLEENNLKNVLTNELELKIKNLTRNKVSLVELEKILKIKNEISEIYTLQLKYGKTDAKELMDIYADAVLAKRKYLKGIIDIKVSEAILYKAMGTLLEKHQINLI
jgi:outer membrane protein TolC